MFSWKAKGHNILDIYINQIHVSVENCNQIFRSLKMEVCGVNTLYWLETESTILVMEVVQ